ncbi:MAG TPA: hypothetical protein ENJ04_03430 [Nitrospirae bacterium]|nr:hypothetical protein [Nitrospirota bacterium]
MVATVPKGVYTMKDRYVIIKHNAKAYQKASKKVKTEMLDKLSAEKTDAKTKELLLKLRASLDIIELAEQIEYLSEELSTAYEKKLRKRKRKAGPPPLSGFLFFKAPLE